MDRNALDWLFSTAPQALAALVGLIFAGVSFVLSNMDKSIEQDDTSFDIYDEMKKTIHCYMKVLFWFAGISILLDLVLIVLNPIEDGVRFSFSGEFDSYVLVAGIILLVNLFTIGFSLFFVLKISSPDFYTKTVSKLSSKYKSGGVDSMVFLKRFIDLEKSLRDLPINQDYQYQKQPTVVEMLRRLRYSKSFTKQEMDELYRMNSIRNLILHGGEIDLVDRDLYDKMICYTDRITRLRDSL